MTVSLDCDITLRERMLNTWFQRFRNRGRHRDTGGNRSTRDRGHEFASSAIETTGKHRGPPTIRLRGTIYEIPGVSPIVDILKGAPVVSLRLDRSARLRCRIRHILSGGLTGFIRKGQSANLRMNGRPRRERITLSAASGVYMRLQQFLPRPVRWRYRM